MLYNYVRIIARILSKAHVSVMIVEMYTVDLTVPMNI